MKTSSVLKVIIGVAILGYIGNILFSSKSEEGQTKYTERILKERTDKDKIFKNKNESPLSEVEMASFEHLNYYPVDYSYRVNAQLEWADKPNKIRINTTQEKAREYYKSCVATFKVNGETVKLTLLKAVLPTPLTKDLLMVIFRDLTADTETYGAGRYIELHGIKKGQMQTYIDFNMAYNPYCAYNDSFDCPLPPFENMINVEIKAGEKRFKEENH
ncbi:DUF1684 domain-containing protein [Flammeovirga yaeyamensis]|uniref:DUF1684 domain-containing protein n=1 Tax=Flammeovirga yaeyamensis TaxID=367791 RepID=A0AAX1NC98_9BACT|nr:DUF1684 domain-containing protein [Flammeovirga yaeyamensis]MBB3698957.1 hypothetical protein [Flammeovirga yaeyamensis]NMF36391.1 DUF1684 domain-containing protein [Flammeovirga yaeyamensis]QWG03648.1 DUF1684 domain-containing protein [Flammeovirga yaeyamensis]